ncbi:Short-chain dehydrogenase, associated with 2-hydroxychromene-2-carboxylate isomerase family protein [Balamuthia mandrillaris]
MEQTLSRVCVVVGAGPGLGRAAAQRFAKQGFSVALLARSKEKLESVAESISQQGGLPRESLLCVPTNATDPQAMEQSFKTVVERLGHPEVMIYNAGSYKRGGILDISPETFEQCWKSNCFGGFLAAQQVLPHMLEQKRGTIIFTGATASLRGSANFSCLSVGKMGLRSLAQSMAREYGPKGVHVAHVIIDGQIDNEYQVGAQPDRPRDSFLSSTTAGLNIDFISIANTRPLGPMSWT